MRHTFAIITFTGGHYPLTQEEHVALQGMPLDGTIQLADGTILKGSSIAEIVPIDNLYKRFPDERPEDPLPEFKAEPRDEYETLEEKAFHNEKASEGLLKGLWAYCVGHPAAQKARDMFDEKIKRHKRLFGHQPDLTGYERYMR